MSTKIEMNYYNGSSYNVLSPCGNIGFYSIEYQGTGTKIINSANAIKLNIPGTWKPLAIQFGNTFSGTLTSNLINEFNNTSVYIKVLKTYDNSSSYSLNQAIIYIYGSFNTSSRVFTFYIQNTPKNFFDATNYTGSDTFFNEEGNLYTVCFLYNY